MIFSTFHLKRCLLIAFCLLALGACATQPGSSADLSQKIAELETQEKALARQQEALKVQESQLAQKNTAVNALESDLAQKEQALSAQIAVANTPAAQSGADINAHLLPPDAKPGECYARVFVSPAYETTTETVLKKAASERIEIIPATYKTVEKQVLVSGESSRLVKVPAQYGTESETIEVSPRKLIWKTSLAKSGSATSKAVLQAAEEHGIDLAAAHPGDCFHEHYLQPVYETVVADELVVEESYKIELIPAQYEMFEERILVSEASAKLVNVPATFKWVEEKMLVKEAHTKWKKGRGLIERVDNTTGELMCLVEVPAEYKSVKKQVVDQPGGTVTKTIPAVYKTVKIKKMTVPPSEKKIVIPAKYKKVESQKIVKAGRFVWHEVKNLEHTRHTRTGNKICLVEIPAKHRTATKTVVVEPAKTVTETIPAVYKTVKVKMVDTAAREKKIVIPAEYQEITKQNKVSEGILEWRKVLCETNTTSDIVAKLQSALILAGYNPGPVDGDYGPKTAYAFKQYQQDKGLATGGFTFETLESLGI